jgi:hypothetical protein
MKLKGKKGYIYELNDKMDVVYTNIHFIPITKLFSFKLLRQLPFQQHPAFLLPKEC